MSKEVLQILSLSRTPGCPLLALVVGPFSKWLSWRLHMANVLNSHWTLNRCMGHCIITNEQGSFPATSNNPFFNLLIIKYCIRLHVMPFTVFNSFPRSLNIITKINLKQITSAYKSISRQHLQLKETTAIMTIVPNGLELWLNCNLSWHSDVNSDIAITSGSLRCEEEWDAIKSW